MTRSLGRRKETSQVNLICSEFGKKFHLSSGSTEIVSFELPFDIVIEILSRLPVKSLIRFKLACKIWYDLIKSPTFIDKHQLHGPVITSILKHSYSDRLYIDDEGFSKMINFDPLLACHTYMRVVGISGGLVCAGFSIRDSDYIIGNPAILEFRRTSQSKLPARWGDLVFLGFSSFSNEYKLVRVVYHISSTGEVVLKAEFYTMSTDIWVEIDVKMGLVDRVVHLRNYKCWYYAMIPVVLNNIFYWEAATSIDMCVVSFDISSGLFDQINVPIGLDTLKPEGDHWRIIEFKEELSFIVSHKDRTFDLWVLDENRSSWTQKLRINNIPTVLSPIEYQENIIAVAGHTRSGEILIMDVYNGSIKKMLLYDLNSLETKSLSNIDVED